MTRRWIELIGTSENLDACAMIEENGKRRIVCFLPTILTEYHAGLVPPNYPVPTLLGETVIGRWAVITFKADYWADDDAYFIKRSS